MEYTNLKDFLKEAGLNPEHDLEPLRAEASSRQYSRIKLLNPGNGPATVILCSGLHVPYNDDDHFVKLATFLRDQQISVPRVLAVDRNQGRILLSDAGEVDLCQALAEKPGRKQDYIKQAIDLALQLQKLAPPPVVAERSFDSEKFQAEFEYLFAAVKGIQEDYKLEDAATFELRMFVNELSRLLAAGKPHVFTHRDYHTRNLMVRQNEAGREELVVLDFQDARMGLPYYDLASLLYDPYAPFDLNDRQMGYTYFRAKFDGELPGPGMYYAQALQRMFKALGTYLFQVHRRGHQVYLPSIPAALQRIEEICQLGRFPDTVFLFARTIQRQYYPVLARGPAALP